MSKLLTNDQALEIYLNLQKIHQINNDWIDKLNSLRTVFDRILILEMLNTLGVRKLPEQYNSFQSKIMYLDQVFPGHSERLERMRKTFNNIHHSTSSDGANRLVSLSRRQYIEILNLLVDHVAKVSGVPTLPSLSLALSEIKKYSEVNERQVIILCQLYNSFEEITNGCRIISEFNEFLSRKNEFGLNNVGFTMMTYSSPFTFRTEASDFFLGVEHKNEIKQWTGWSLNRALELLDVNINIAHDRKPWLIWICSEIPDGINPYPFEEISRMSAEDQIVFYPVYTTEKAGEQLNKLFAGQYPPPVKLNPSKAGQFFNSIALTLQRVEKK